MNLITIKNVRGYVEDEKVFLKLEDVARGLGFEKREIKNGKEYVRWNKQIVKNWLIDFGIINSEDNIPDFIPENIFYKLCMKANNSVARIFQDKVCDEILPEIRRTGGYIATKEDDTDEEIMARALLVAQRTIERKNERIKQLENKVEEDKPKVEFYNDVTESKDTVDMGTVAKILNIKGVGRNKLFEILRNKKVLMANNQPYQKYLDLGWFRQIETKFNLPNGDVKINIKTVVFQKGVDGISKILKKLDS